MLPHVSIEPYVDQAISKIDTSEPVTPEQLKSVLNELLYEFFNSYDFKQFAKDAVLK